MKYKLLPVILAMIALTSYRPVLPVTYIYGYNNSLLMAEVFNAKQNEVAFTSFESVDKGYWSFNGTVTGSVSDRGRTGIKYYDLSSGSIQRSDLPDGKYIVSYWSRLGGATITGTNYTVVKDTYDPGSGWEYREQVFQISGTGSITLSGNIRIDELRLYPSAATMVTYTYNPLVGKTSETDINNNSMFYEYDEFYRLKYVKDHLGNIRKNFIYHHPGFN